MKEPKKLEPVVFNDRLSIYNNWKRYYLDEHAYASILANIIRAKKCICSNDITTYYDREHWVMLLLHYINGLMLLVDAFPEAITYIPATQYNNLVIIKHSKQIYCRGMYMEHRTCLNTDADILEYFIIAATSIQTIIENNIKLKTDLVTRLVSRSLESSERENEYKDSGVKRYYRKNGKNK